jgi:GntR family transcriptional regulator
MTGPHLSLAARRAVTLHTRIREELRARIVSGAWQPLDRMPSESALMSQYGVSRITVRQALGDLEHDRLIFKVPGKGSFVAQPKPFQDLGRLQGFGEAMSAQGHITSNRLLGARELPAPANVAARLRLLPGDPVTELQRLRCLDGLPVSLDVTWLPRAIGAEVARQDLQRRDVFLILERDLGLSLGHAELALDASLADARLAALLEIPAGDPVLRVERLTYSREGQPLDFEHLFCRSDRFQFRLRLNRDGAP